MPRKSVLEDRLKRNRVLRVLADGGTDADAAAEIGTTRQAIYRYCENHPDYAEAVERAKAKAAAMVEPGTVPGIEPPPPVVERQPLTAEAIEASRTLAVDAEVIVDLDEHLHSDLELPTPEGLPRLTVRSFTDLCWRRANSDRKDAAAWGRLLAPVMFGPTLRAQERRLDAAGGGVLEAEAMGDGRPRGPVKPRGSNLVVLTAPPNKARPFLQAEDDASDAAE